jgi:hypothetical protein
VFWTNYRFALQAKSLRRENPLSIRVAINTMKICVAGFPPFPGPYLFSDFSVLRMEEKVAFRKKNSHIKFDSRLCVSTSSWSVA